MEQLDQNKKRENLQKHTAWHKQTAGPGFPTIYLPCWEQNPDSKLENVLSRTFESIYHIPLKHKYSPGGTEYGIFSQNIPCLDIVAFGPIREKDYSSICETDTPRPNTAYGLSKLHTEEYLKSLTNFPYVIFRPTGVYGPRERDYFLMAKSVQQHVDLQQVQTSGYYVCVCEGLGTGHLPGY